MHRPAPRLFGKPLTRVLDYGLGIQVVGLLSLIKMKRRSWPANIRRIGVICSPTMGDTVLLSGPLLDLRKYFNTGIEIVQICGRKNILAAESGSAADRHLVIDLTKPFAAARLMKEQHFDILFDFSSWQRVTAALALTSGSRFTVGFRSPGQFRTRGYDRTVLHRADQHELDNFRDLLRGCGIPADTAPRISVSDVSLPEPWSSCSDIVVFHLWPAGGPDSMREWPEQHWFTLARALARPGRIFAITGSPADQARSEAFADRLLHASGAQALAFSGGQGLRQLVTLLRRARLVVSVNTGVMHLASVAGAPTVSLNGPTADRRWGPRGPCSLGVSPSDGSGGYLHFGFEFHTGLPDVMPRILPQQVIEASQKLERRPRVESDKPDSDE